MNSNVNASIKESIINFLGEESLSSDICQGLVQDLISGRLDDDDFDGSILSQFRETSL